MKKKLLYPEHSVFILLMFFATACNKQNEFLNAKPNQSLVVPVSLSDYQSILDNTNIFNSGNDPALGEMSSDDFYIQDDVFPNLSATERNSYIWASNIYDADETPADWSSPYLQVYYANVVLDGLPHLKISAAQQTQYNQERGAALFYRSYAFYNLVQTFALPYDSGSDKTDPGIPLRLNSDITIKAVRASNQDCYNQIISDVITALPLLVKRTSVPTKPSAISAYAFLARVYLAMSDYQDAMMYAKNALALNHELVDYNTLNSPTSTSVSSAFLTEDIFHSSLVNYSMLAVRRNSVIDSSLYASYDDNDLRKTKFFAVLDGLPQFPRFVGSYDFDGYKFDGLATDELYLIKAECEARAGDTNSAMTDLNTLLAKRYLSGTFSPYTAVSADDALIQILRERRKELLYRGLRWTDLRRLNNDARFRSTLLRNVNAIAYTLLPNDPKYALPIPEPEIALSGIAQNQR